MHRAVEIRSGVELHCWPSIRLRAPTDGIVLALHSTVGSYVSPQGAYDSYTQAMNPLIGHGHASRSNSRCGRLYR